MKKLLLSLLCIFPSLLLATDNIDFLLPIGTDINIYAEINRIKSQFNEGESFSSLIQKITGLRSEISTLPLYFGFAFYFGVLFLRINHEREKQRNEHIKAMLSKGAL